MGGSSYDRDVYSSSSYSNWGSSSTAQSKLNSTSLDSSMSPKGKVIKSKSKNPIIIMLDVTGSNINFARLVYDKLPMFYGEIEKRGYFKDFDISICAVGDAYCDDYPLQIGDFAKGIEIDSQIEKIVLESGGGGQRSESYELAAHYLVNSVEFSEDASPMVFFIADEKPYDKVSPSQAEEIGLPASSYDPFPALNKKFKDKVYVMLNRYCGREFDSDITDKWKSKMPTQHVIRIPEEKAIVDLMLGTIALESQNDLDVYAIDMKNRGQTQARIGGVTSSLKELSDSMALQKVDEVGVDLANQMKLIRKPGTGQRL